MARPLRALTGGGRDPFLAAPWLAIALFAAPLGTGLAGTLLPAFGWLPGLGGTPLSIEPWQRLLAAPELAGAVRVTLSSGLLGTAGALALAVLLVAGLHARPVFALLRPCLLPLLAIPHLALAVGLAFLLAPSGWIARLAALPLGWALPPDRATVNDPAGLALALGLAVKEAPFLALVLLAAAGQVRAPRQVAVARSLGYGPGEAWLKVVLPQLYPLVRLPLFAVFAYSMSVVDVAIVLGPATPPPLAPLILRWLNDPDLSLRFPAAAAALLLVVLLAAALAAWHGLERALARWLRPSLGRGAAPRCEPWLGVGGGLAAATVVGLGLLALLALCVWSFAGRWEFPAFLPETWSTRPWSRALPLLGGPLWSTVWIAALCALVALVLVIACVEHEALAGRRPTHRVLALAYLPLLVPQLAFLFGFAVLLAYLRLDGTALAVVWAHLVFVLPYTLLLLREPWLALDPRFARTAHALGKGELTVLLHIKLPILLRPVLIAMAIGIAVSAAQYLTTLFAGAGRVPTLATETLAMASAGDRRSAAVGGLILALLPLTAIAVATSWPRLRARRRRGLA